jgi:hypothetical protein
MASALDRDGESVGNGTGYNGGGIIGGLSSVEGGGGNGLARKADGDDGVGDKSHGSDKNEWVTEERVEE